MKGRIILIVIITALLGGAFYWFQWRPSEIRKECVKKTLEIGKGKNLSASEISLGLDFCLQSYGLEK